VERCGEPFEKCEEVFDALAVVSGKAAGSSRVNGTIEVGVGFGPSAGGIASGS